MKHSLAVGGREKDSLYFLFYNVRWVPTICSRLFASLVSFPRVLINYLVGQVKQMRKWMFHKCQVPLFMASHHRTWRRQCPSKLLGQLISKLPFLWHLWQTLAIAASDSRFEGMFPHCFWLFGLIWTLAPFLTWLLLLGFALRYPSSVALSVLLS